MWANALIVFDANVLLDLYRYSKEARESLFAVIEHYGERVWIPRHAAEEYHRSLHKVINDQAGTYASLVKKVETFVDELDKEVSTRRHPHLDDTERATLKTQLAAATDSLNKKCSAPGFLDTRTA